VKTVLIFERIAECLQSDMFSPLNLQASLRFSTWFSFLQNFYYLRVVDTNKGTVVCTTAGNP